MKKFFYLSVCLVLALLSLVGCVSGASGNSSNNQDFSEEQNDNSQGTPVPENTTPAKTEPTTVALTTANINEYLIFSVKCDDVEVESAGYLSYKMGEGKATTKTSPKKNVEFSDVKITFTLTTSSSAWANIENQQIEIPFNGISENTCRIASRIEDYVSSSPSYTVNVTSVSGSVIVK